MSRFRTFFLTLALATFSVACGESDGAAVLGPAAPNLSSTGPVLVECPVDTTISTSGQLGTLGGELRLRNHRLSLPSLAVVGPTDFGLAAPASNYMELRIKANGQESFTFQKPVSITIDYSRCTRSNIDKAPLTVWQIDPVTKQLIEHMGGVDDKVNRTITFQTDHLSTYSIAQ